MGAFDSGFQMGSGIVGKAMDRNEDRRRYDAEFALRQAAEERAKTEFEDKQAALARARGIQAQVDELGAQITNPNRASYKLAEGSGPGLRMPAQGNAAPSAQNFDAPISMDAPIPAPQGLRMPDDRSGATGVRAQASTAPVGEYVAPPTRGAVEEILAKRALLQGKDDDFRTAQNNKRGFDFEDAWGKQIKAFNDMPPADRAAFLERTTQDVGIPINVEPLIPAKGQKGDQYSVWVKGRPEVIVGRNDLADLYAAGNLLAEHPEKARARLEAGSAKVRQIYKDYIDHTDKVMDTNNQAARFRSQDANESARLAISAQAAKAAAQAAKMGLVRAYEDPKTGELKEMYPVTGRDGKVTWEEVPTPAGMRPYNPKKEGAEFEKLPDDGTKVRDKKNNVLTYIEGIPTLPGGVPPSAQEKTLETLRMPPQAHSMVSWNPGGRFIKVPGLEGNYDIKDSADMEAVRKHLKELSVRAVNEQEAGARLATGMRLGQGRRDGVLDPRLLGPSAADAALATYQSRNPNR